MKSIKNHLSLIIALVSILFSIQVFMIVDRSIESYKQNLSSNYSIVIVSQKKLTKDNIKNMDALIKDSSELSTDSVIKRLNTGMTKQNMELLKLTLPKFYKLHLSHYPSPSEIQKLKKNLLQHIFIVKVENFSHNHDTIYKLLLLFKNVIFVFAITVFIVTSLLIFKELRIWQFKHSERMNIMGLFGAPTWLSSAVLFRLSLVDAFFATLIVSIFFIYISSNTFILSQFDYIGIKIDIFDPLYDSALLFGVALLLSVILASSIVLGHKEEV